MASHKRTKSSRQRGTTTHGCGSMKKRRDAGHRGGRGRSGSGKRGDQKKPRYWKDKNRPEGFYSLSRMPKMKPINIKSLDDNLDHYVAKKKAKVAGGLYTVNLADLGFNKLLSTGKVLKKMKITTEYATPKAIEKVKEAGGEVILVATKLPKVKSEKSE